MRSRSLNGRLLPVWTEAMDAELARLAPTCSAAEIAQAVSAMSGLSISRKAVSRRAYGKGVQLRVGSHASPIWTEAMDIELARLAPTCSASEMARILSPMFGRPITRSAVIGRAYRKGIALRERDAARPNGFFWTEAMDAELARLKPTHSAAQAARIVGFMFGLPITRGAVASRTRRLARAKCRANAARLGKLWSP